MGLMFGKVKEGEESRAGVSFVVRVPVVQGGKKLAK